MLVGKHKQLRKNKHGLSNNAKQHKHSNIKTAILEDYEEKYENPKKRKMNEKTWSPLEISIQRVFVGR